MKNFIQDGKTLTFTAPSGGVVSGGFYKIGQLVVVAVHDAAQGDPFEAESEGVFTAPKATGEAWAEGAVLAFDGTEFTTTVSGEVIAGCAAAVAGSGDTTGKVRLNGVARPDEA